MAARIRLSRIGTKKKPIYRIVVMDSHSSRDGRKIEVIGHYDPKLGMEKADLKKERLQYWLGCGVKPTVAVAQIIKRANVAVPKT